MGDALRSGAVRPSRVILQTVAFEFAVNDWGRWRYCLFKKSMV